MSQPETRKAFLQIHFCVLLWGFTAILGKLITLPALPLVWWRMLIVVAALALVPATVLVVPATGGADLVEALTEGEAALSTLTTVLVAGAPYEDERA